MLLLKVSDETYGYPHRFFFPMSLSLSLSVSKLSLVLFGLLNVVSVSAGVTAAPGDVNGQTFDYIVVGAGLAGTTVAARLAEDAGVSVLLIEAGADDREDPRVYDIYAYSQSFGTELDWAWDTDQGRVMRG